MASWTDDFNRASLGANWSGSVGGDLQIQSSTYVIGVSTADNSMYWNANTPAAAQYAQVNVGNIGNNRFRGPFVRGSATDWVFLDANGNNGQWTIEWYNGGLWTQIGAAYAVAPAANDIAKIAANGSDFEGFVNGTSRITGSNGSAPSTGYTGLYCWNNTTSETQDDFEGGDLGSPPAGGEPNSAWADFWEQNRAGDTFWQDVSAVAGNAASIVEAATAADVSAAALITSAARVEAASAVDSPAATLTTLAARVEAANATDTQGASFAFTAAITEGTSAGDTAGAAKAVAGAMAEPASATDAPGAVKVASAAIAEPGTAIDTPAASRIAAAGMAEPASAADTTGTATVRQAAITEAATAIETPGALRSMTAALSEAASAVDQQATSGGAAFDAGMTEPANALDSPAATLVTGASQVEAAAAIDSQAVSQTSAAAMGEPAEAVESLAALLFAGAILAEAGGSIDALDAVVVGGTVGDAAMEEAALTLMDGFAYTSGLTSEEQVPGAMSSGETSVVLVAGG